MTTFEYKKWQYYIVATIIAIVFIVFLPFFGSDIGMAIKLPTSFAGWFIYVLTKLLAGIFNILLFYCFMEQAKVNVSDNPKFIEANEILERYKKLQAYKPLGPEEWQLQQYKGKGLAIGITSILSAIGLAHAVLTFDWITMFTYLFILIFGCITGYLQMTIAEKYWTGEYWDYAKMVEREMEMVTTECNKQENVDIYSGSGNDILVPSSDSSISSVNN